MLIPCHVSWLTRIFLVLGCHPQSSDFELSLPGYDLVRDIPPCVRGFRELLLSQTSDAQKHLTNLSQLSTIKERALEKT